MYEFSPFYQILLCLFHVSNVFSANIEQKHVKQCKHFKCHHETQLKREITLTKFN